MPPKNAPAGGPGDHRGGPPDSRPPHRRQQQQQIDSPSQAATGWTAEVPQRPAPSTYSQAAQLSQPAQSSRQGLLSAPNNTLNTSLPPHLRVARPVIPRTGTVSATPNPKHGPTPEQQTHASPTPLKTVVDTITDGTSSPLSPHTPSNDQPPPPQQQTNSRMPVPPRLSPEALHNLEDQHVKELNQKQSSQTETAQLLDQVCRPAYGTRIDEVSLEANFFPLALVAAGDLILHRYGLEVLPMDGKSPSPSKVTRIQCVRTWFDNLDSRIAAVMVTDFQSCLYCLYRSETDEKIEKVKVRNQFEQTPHDKARTYNLKRTHDKALNVTDYLRYLRDTNFFMDPGTRNEVYQALNIFLDHYVKSQPRRFVTLNSRSFDLTEKASRRVIPGGLETMQGFFDSIRPATGRLLLNVQPSTRVFVREGRLDEVVLEWWRENARFDSEEENLQALETFLTDLYFIPVHEQNAFDKVHSAHPRIYKIRGLAHPGDGKPLSTDPDPHQPKVSEFGAKATEVCFWDRDHTPEAQYVTVKNYFRARYPKFSNKCLTEDDGLPVIKAGPEHRPEYFPAKACRVIAGQQYTGQLTAKQTSEVIKVARNEPHENVKRIMNSGLSSIGTLAKDNPRLAIFGIQVDQSLVTVPARQLPQPQLLYAKATRAPIVNGVWKIDKKRFLKGAQVGVWMVIRILEDSEVDVGKPESDQQKSLETAASLYKQTLSSMGMNIWKPVSTEIIRIRDANDSQLPALFDDTIRKANRDLRFILIVKRDESRLMYNKLKQLCDQVHGVHSSCMTADKFFGISKPNVQAGTFRTEALSVNTKLGGVNHELKSEVSKLMEKKTMNVGADVTHGHQGSNQEPTGRPSVSALAGSTTPDGTQYRVVTCVQEAPKTLKGGAVEMIDTKMKEMLPPFLDAWEAANGEPPINILFVRDGLSESQFAQAKEEVRAILDLLSTRYHRKIRPSLIYVICTKRHNSRLYHPITVKERDKEGKIIEVPRHVNPQAGTVVDRGITQSRLWEFLMQTHKALQGTARPAKYTMIHDEIFGELAAIHGLNAQCLLELVLYNMCYLFGRSHTSVSIPPPVYYAHVACERAKLYLDLEWNRSLRPPPDAIKPKWAKWCTAEADIARARLNAWYQQFVYPAIQPHPRLKDTMYFI